MQRLILRSFQSPGDIVMLTAAVRDLHTAAPGQFQTDVRTSAPALWENNPHLTPLREGDAGVQMLDMHYPLIHQSNQRPYHFLHGYVQYLEQQLGLRIPVTRFHGDIYLTAEERQIPLPDLEDRFWIVIAGGKYDFTAKWWDPGRYQKVVDHYRDRLSFIQCGEAGHWHPRLQGVVDLVGRTSLRDFVRLMYHAAGVLCGVTFAMHLAAAVPVKPGRHRKRPCVVVAGGREPPHWEAYPHHQFLSTVGMLPCCGDGGCWKSRCQLVGDGDAKDRHNVCAYPVPLSNELRIPRCMHMITAEDAIRCIDHYLEGEALFDRSIVGTTALAPPAQDAPLRSGSKSAPSPSQTVLLEFRHGLGDAVQLTVVLQHLQHYHPEWAIDVASLAGKHSAFTGLCRRSLIVDREPIDRTAYDRSFILDWHECRTLSVSAPRTKPIRCLREVFGLEPISELCGYRIHYGDQARQQARRYLASVCSEAPGSDGRYRVVLLHYQGNTSSEHKDLSHDLAREVCAVILQAGAVPVILDWDGRSPLPDGTRIHNPGARHELWGGAGTGDAAVLAALIDAAILLIGVDSGPLHVAGASDTPVIAVWTQHHPVHSYDLARNVLHLVPSDHAKYVRGPDVLDYFRQFYRHRTYRQLAIELPALIESYLTGEDAERIANRRFLKQLSATDYGENYYHEHRRGGLDYLDFGDWQQQYGQWLVESLGWRGQRVLDVGCACGSILRGLGEAGAVVGGVDVNEYMIRLGRDKWPDMASLLHICDAVNLHLFGAASWDAVHTAQVAEHWRPELVPFILRELARVVRPGGLLFCALDTEELFARQGRRLEDEDPTHVCIRPLRWWHERLAETDWQLCTKEHEPVLRGHPVNFLQRYDWDWFVARRANG